VLLGALLVVACSGNTSTSPSPTVGATARSTPLNVPLPAGRSADEWLTYLGDPVRSGIGAQTPQATNAHRTWTASVDGDVYAAPLVSAGTVFAATEHDTVYALDAGSGAVRWSRHLGEPVPLSSLSCGNIDPNGVTSTPVLDPAAQLVYVVAMLDTPVRHEMFALHLGDGSIAWHRNVDPPGADPHVYQQRGSLNLNGGRIYFSYGGFTGDCGTYHGTVAAAPADPAQPLLFFAVPSEVRAAIWAAAGPVIAGNGDVWVSTGNSDVFNADNAPYDDNNAVIHLDATLAHALDLWAPGNWAALNTSDTDLGSLSPALLPGGLVFIAGKNGIGYLLRQSHLGGIGGEAYSDTVCRNGGPTGGAYGAAAVAADMVFVPCKDGLFALHVNAAKPSFSAAWHAAPGASAPVLAYGLLWTVAANPDGYRQVWNGSLVGLDPATGAEKIRLPLGGVPHFPSPAAATGRIFVAGLGGVYAISVT
jgi:outer membrane protein assembly factor BamB